MAVASCREWLGVGMARTPGRTVGLTARNDNARSDPPRDAAPAGKAPEVAGGRNCSRERGTRGTVIAPAPRMSYARRQQHRRLSCAGKAAIGGTAAAVLGVEAASVGAVFLAAPLLVVTIALGLYAGRGFSLAHRSRVGHALRKTFSARSLPCRGRAGACAHSQQWQGRGDIDSVAIAPTGIAVAIETKTRTYDRSQLARVGELAAWLSRRRRRWACSGALGVTCLIRVRASSASSMTSWWSRSIA